MITRVSPKYFVNDCSFQKSVKFSSVTHRGEPYFVSLLKVIRFALNVIESHLYNIVIKDLEKNKYSEEPKTALVRPIFKKNERSKIRNCNYCKWNA